VARPPGFFACGLLTQYTAFFATVHVFIVMQIGTQCVVHVGVTDPTLDWVKLQTRDIVACRGPVSPLRAGRDR
jgi:hypothetical protein